MSPSFCSGRQFLISFPEEQSHFQSSVCQLFLGTCLRIGDWQQSDGHSPPLESVLSTLLRRSKSPRTADQESDHWHLLFQCHSPSFEVASVLCALPWCHLGFSVPFLLPPCQHYILQYQNYTMKQALSNFNHYKCPSLRNTTPCFREKQQLTMPKARAYDLLHKTSFLSTSLSLALDVA